jgi:hypothetical protein
VCRRWAAAGAEVSGEGLPAGKVTRTVATWSGKLFPHGGADLVNLDFKLQVAALKGGRAWKKASYKARTTFESAVKEDLMGYLWESLFVTILKRSLKIRSRSGTPTVLEVFAGEIISKAAGEASGAKYEVRLTGQAGGTTYRPDVTVTFLRSGQKLGIELKSVSVPTLEKFLKTDNHDNSLAIDLVTDKGYNTNADVVISVVQFSTGAVAVIWVKLKERGRESRGHLYLPPPSEEWRALGRFLIDFRDFCESYMGNKEYDQDIVEGTLRIIDDCVKGQMDAMLRDGLNKLKKDGDILEWKEAPGFEFLLLQGEYRTTIFRFLQRDDISARFNSTELKRSLKDQPKKIVYTNEESSARAAAMGRLQDIRRDGCLTQLRATARGAVEMHAWIQHLRQEREQEQEQEQEQGYYLHLLSSRS